MRCIFEFGLIKAGIGWPVQGDAGGGAGLELATGTFKFRCICRLQTWKTEIGTT